MSKQQESWDRDLARVIDHTVLGASVDEADVRRACDEARRYGFATVVAAPEFLRVLVRALGGSGVRTCTVVSFPSGEDLPAEKAAAARRLIERGADELDVVMNVAAFVDGRTDEVREEVEGLVKVCRKRAVLKLIIETALLTPQQIAAAAKLVSEAGASFVKTSTGTASRGASIEDIEIIRKSIRDGTRIKASGGIRTGKFARDLLAAGAHRIGCSASIEVVKS